MSKSCTKRHSVQNRLMAPRSNIPVSGSTCHNRMCWKVGRNGEKYIAPRCTILDCSDGAKWHEPFSSGLSPSAGQDTNLMNTSLFFKWPTKLGDSTGKLFRNTFRNAVRNFCSFSPRPLHTQKPASQHLDPLVVFTPVMAFAFIVLQNRMM